MARSDACISAIFARTSRSPSAFCASAFCSLARSFIAARSSSVNPLDFFALIVPSCADSSMSYSVRQERVYLRPRALTSRFLIGLVTCLATHDGNPSVARRPAPIDAGRHTDQLGEANGEGAKRRAADLETDLGDA